MRCRPMNLIELQMFLDHPIRTHATQDEKARQYAQPQRHALGRTR
jgi:hypothetical protein